MRAFAYIRVSGQSQVDGDGPERQRAAIRRFARENLGYTHDELPEYEDEGVSGTVDALSRPGFVEMIDYIKSVTDTEPACVVVERMDRLARDLIVQEMLLRECRTRGIHVYATDQGRVDDDANPSRTLIRQIFGAIAQWEKSVIVSKLKAARQRKKQATGRCEGVKPYGQLNPGEAVVVNLIRDMWDVFSARKIAEFLNEQGHCTRSGKPWNKSRVIHIYQQHIKHK